MRLVADMIANTIARHRTEAQLKATEAKLLEANVKLAQLARQDSLTGLFNRRGLDECFEHELRRAIRNQHALTIIMVDIDHFKQLNDTQGHLFGDQILIAVATILAKNFKRSGEYVARFGGDEFMIVCPQTEPHQLQRQAEKVLQEVRALKQSSPAAVSVSIGMLSVVPEPSTNTDDLMRAVDNAVYAAKQDGRDCIKNMR